MQYDGPCIATWPREPDNTLEDQAKRAVRKAMTELGRQLRALDLEQQVDFAEVCRGRIKQMLRLTVA